MHQCQFRKILLGSLVWLYPDEDGFLYNPQMCCVISFVKNKTLSGLISTTWHAIISIHISGLFPGPSQSSFATTTTSLD